MVAAGKLDRLVTFFQRAPLPTTPGVPRGGFMPMSPAIWAGYEERPSFRIAIGDFHVNVPSGLLTLRDDPFSRAIRRSHQVEIDGFRFTVRAVGLPQRKDASITFEVIGAESLDLYASYIDAEGEMVVIRRLGTPQLNASVRAHVTGYKPKELVAGMRQGDRQILLLAADVEAAGWSPPLNQTDRVVVRGDQLTMRSLDDSTHRFAGVLLAYETVAGG